MRRVLAVVVLLAACGALPMGVYVPPVGCRDPSDCLPGYMCALDGGTDDGVCTRPDNGCPYHCGTPP